MKCLNQLVPEIYMLSPRDWLSKMFIDINELFLYACLLHVSSMRIEIRKCCKLDSFCQEIGLTSIRSSLSRDLECLQFDKHSK